MTMTKEQITRWLEEGDKSVTTKETNKEDVEMNETKKNLTKMVEELKVESASTAARYTDEELAAMKKKAMTTGELVVASGRAKKVITKQLPNIDGQVAKSVMYNYYKRDGSAWASKAQLGKMKHYALDKDVKGVEVEAGEFIIGFANKKTIDYFLCDDAGVRTRYTTVNGKVEEVKSSTPTGTEYKRMVLASGTTSYGVEGRATGDYKTGTITYKDGSKYDYEFNTAKYDLPRITTEGFDYKDLKTIKQLVLAYYAHANEVGAEEVEVVADGLTERFEASLYE